VIADLTGARVLWRKGLIFEGPGPYGPLGGHAGGAADGAEGFPVSKVPADVRGKFVSEASGSLGHRSGPPRPLERMGGASLGRLGEQGHGASPMHTLERA